MRKLTLEFVAGEFEKRGYELIETDYINSGVKMKYRCPKHPDKDLYIKYDNFKMGKGCKYCGLEKAAKGRKLKYIDVKKVFESRGYILLEDSYIKGNVTMRYICSKHPHEIQKTTYYLMKNGTYICKHCKGEAIARSKKLDYEFVKAEFEKRGYELLDDKYENNHTVMRYVCPTHPDEVLYKSYNNLKKGSGCPICYESKGEKRIREWLEHHNVSFVSQYTFEELLGVGGNPLRFDFAVFQDQKLKILIEYDGIFHFENKYMDSNHYKTIVHDEMKNKFCVDKNISLLRIPYWEDDEIENLLFENINFVEVIGK